MENWELIQDFESAITKLVAAYGPDPSVVIGMLESLHVNINDIMQTAQNPVDFLRFTAMLAVVDTVRANFIANGTAYPTDASGDKCEGKKYSEPEPVAKKEKSKLKKNVKKKLGFKLKL